MRIVELTTELANPDVDRRAKRDWTKAETFKPGRYFDNGSTIQDPDARFGFLRGRDRDRFLEHCVAAAPRDAREVLFVCNLENCATDVLDVLIARGKITAEDIRDTVDTVFAKYE